jgi:type IV pilus assembly protein PilQ
MKKTFIFILLFVFLFSLLFPDSKTEEYKSEELITILKDTNFIEAIRAFEQMSQQFEGRKIINLSNYTGPINIPIKQLHWKEALQLVIDFNGLILTELPGVYQIKDVEVIKASGGEEISPDTKQVRISAIFFKLNESFSNNVGIDWSTLLNGEVTANLDFKGASAVSEELFSAAASGSFESGNYTFDINTLLRIIEAYQEGTIVARPNIIVLSGREGFIQVGEDFSVKTRDENGNTIEVFFETGIILEVTPTVIQQGDNEAIHLIAKVEKSTAFPGVLSTIIHKSASETEILLYDGEETVIGGLYDTDINVTRKGIPILKDLPWWVFGIRYLTGFNKTEKASSEMIIILQVEILMTIDERREQLTPLKDRIKSTREDNRAIKDLFEDDIKSIIKE